jgi:hypothetical protein
MPYIEGWNRGYPDKNPMPGKGAPASAAIRHISHAS